MPAMNVARPGEIKCKTGVRDQGSGVRDQGSRAASWRGWRACADQARRIADEKRVCGDLLGPRAITAYHDIAIRGAGQRSTEENGEGGDQIDIKAFCELYRHLSERRRSGETPVSPGDCR